MIFIKEFFVRFKELLKENYKKYKEECLQQAVKDFSCCNWGNENLTIEDIQELYKYIDIVFKEREKEKIEEEKKKQIEKINGKMLKKYITYTNFDKKYI